MKKIILIGLFLAGGSGAFAANPFGDDEIKIARKIAQEAVSTAEVKEARKEVTKESISREKFLYPGWKEREFQALFNQYLAVLSKSGAKLT